jgi:hypothetical protein
MEGLFEIRLIMIFAIELVVATIIACANLFHSPLTEGSEPGMTLSLRRRSCESFCRAA